MIRIWDVLLNHPNRREAAQVADDLNDQGLVESVLFRFYLKKNSKEYFTLIFDDVGAGTFTETELFSDYLRFIDNYPNDEAIRREAYEYFDWLSDYEFEEVLSEYLTFGLNGGTRLWKYQRLQNVISYFIERKGIRLKYFVWLFVQNPSLDYDMAIFLQKASAVIVEVVANNAMCRDCMIEFIREYGDDEIVSSILNESSW